jgi:septal ring factor EnvC (AmiA/AmiB activator)
MQQDDEDRKNEVIVKGLEDKIKKLEDSLKEKDELLCSAEGSLTEAQVENKKLGKELADAQTLLEESSSRFNHESKTLKMTLKVEAVTPCSRGKTECIAYVGQDLFSTHMLMSQV